jgi:hypothetical protein
MHRFGWGAQMPMGDGQDRRWQGRYAIKDECLRVSIQEAVFPFSLADIRMFLSCVLHLYLEHFTASRFIYLHSSSLQASGKNDKAVTGVHLTRS